MNKWDEYFFRICETVSSQSKDPSSQIGAVIVGPGREIVSTGYNDFPRGVRDNQQEVPERWGRPLKYDFVVHAELNAILNAARTGASLDGCSLYVIRLPICKECAKAIINAGIKKVYMNFDPAMIDLDNPELPEKYRNWAEQWHKRSSVMFKESGVEYKNCFNEIKAVKPGYNIVTGGQLSWNLSKQSANFSATESLRKDFLEKMNFPNLA